MHQPTSGNLEYLWNDMSHPQCAVWNLVLQLICAEAKRDSVFLNGLPNRNWDLQHLRVFSVQAPPRSGWRGGMWKIGTWELPVQHVITWDGHMEADQDVDLSNCQQPLAPSVNLQWLPNITILIYFNILQVCFWLPRPNQSPRKEDLYISLPSFTESEVECIVSLS
jgi:hypothetical protein